MLDNSHEQSSFLWGGVGSPLPSPSHKVFSTHALHARKRRHISGLGSVTTFACEGQQQQWQLERQYLTLELTNKDETIESLKEQLKTCMLELKKVQSKYQRLKNISKGEWERSHAVDKERQKVRYDMGELERRNQQLKQKCSKLQDIHTEEQSRIVNLQKYLLQCKQSQSGLMTENTELQSQLSYFKHQLNKLAACQNETLDAFEDLYEEVHELRHYREMYTNLMEHKNQQVVRVSGLEQLITFQKQRLEKLDIQSVKEKALVQHLTGMLTESNRLLGLEVEQNHQLRRALEKTMEQQHIEREALESQNDFLQSLVRDLQKQVEQLRKASTLKVEQRDILDTAMNSSRLVTHPIKQQGKENINPSNRTPPQKSIKVTNLETCARRVGSIKLMKLARKTLPQNQNKIVS